MTVERLISKCINTSNKNLNFLLLGCDVMVIIECISYFLLCIWIDAKVIYINLFCELMIYDLESEGLLVEVTQDGIKTKF